MQRVLQTLLQTLLFAFSPALPPYLNVPTQDTSPIKGWQRQVHSMNLDLQ